MLAIKVLDDASRSTERHTGNRGRGGFKSDIRSAFKEENCDLSSRRGRRPGNFQSATASVSRAWSNWLSKDIKTSCLRKNNRC